MSVILKEFDQTKKRINELEQKVKDGTITDKEEHESGKLCERHKILQELKAKEEKETPVNNEGKVKEEYLFEKEYQRNIISALWNPKFYQDHKNYIRPENFSFSDHKWIAEQLPENDRVELQARAGKNEHLKNEIAYICDHHNAINFDNISKAIKEFSTKQAIRKTAKELIEDYAKDPLLVKNNALGNLAVLDGLWQKPLPLVYEGQSPEFPVEALAAACPMLDEYCRAISHSLQTPIELPLGFGLSVIALSVAGKAKVAIRDDVFLSVNLWTLTSLCSGEKKSPVLRLLREPIDEYQQYLIERDTSKIREAKAQRIRDIAKLEQLNKAAIKLDVDDQELYGKIRALEAKIEKPLPYIHRHLIDDATPESMAQLMVEQNGRVAALQDEATLLEVVLGRYSGKPNIELLLKGFDGDSYSVDRKGKEPILIKNAFVTLGLSVQPDVLNNLLQLPERGFMPRFLIAAPASNLGNRKFPKTPFPVVLSQEWKARIFNLLNQGGLISLKPANMDLIFEFEEKIESKLLNEYQFIQADANKACGNAVRLAALFHLFNGFDGNEIGDDLIMQSIKIIEYYLKSAIAIKQGVEQNSRLALAIKIKNAYIDRTSEREFTLRSVTQHEGRHVTKEQLEDALDILVRFNWIKIQEKPKKFIINPLGGVVQNVDNVDMLTGLTC